MNKTVKCASRILFNPNNDEPKLNISENNLHVHFELNTIYNLEEDCKVVIYNYFVLALIPCQI